MPGMKIKYTIFMLLLFIFASRLLADDQDSLLDQGEKIFYSMNSTTVAAKAIEAMDNALAIYKLCMAKGQNEKVLYDYTEDINLKYYYLDAGTKDDKFKAYDDTIKLIEVSGLDPENSAVYNYCLALMWARRGDIMDLFDAARNGVADKIKNYAEKAYKLDKTIDKNSVMLILGRLHYKSPNIPLLLTWPDKQKSKTYLEEALKADLSSLMAQFYLADTLWELGEKDQAVKYYNQVTSTAARQDDYWKDMKIKSLCSDRIKELGIK